MMCEISPIRNMLSSVDNILTKSVPYDSSTHFHGTKPRIVEPYYMYRSNCQRGTLEVELPGVDKDDIVVEVQGSSLKITGKRTRDTEDTQRSKKLKADMWGARGDVEKVMDKAEENIEDKVPAAETAKVDAQTDEGNSLMEARDVSSEEARRREVDEGSEGYTMTYKAQFHLHPSIDTSAIAVEKYRGGVLRLTIPKKKDYVRQISIS